MYLFKDATTYTASGFKKECVYTDGFRISKNAPFPKNDCIVIDSNNLFIVPAFVDVHIHLREPGFFYKETILNGTKAAASAGYTTVCTMPNLNPVPDCIENLEVQEKIIQKTAMIDVLPYASITKGENGEALSDMEQLAPRVFAFSDDGRGVQSDDMMERAMLKAKSLGKVIVAHCEDNLLLNGGYIHDGEYAKVHGHKGICSESEWKQIERDLKLVEKTDCRYHICHISTKESVELIRKAKKKGLKVTCETAPHYLVLCQDDLKEEGRFKMNPPLRNREDKDALINGLNDGTIDVIATDHAPHSDEEKSKGLSGSLMGVVGLETAFPVLYTKLVLEKKVNLETLIKAMSINPRKIFGLEEVLIEDGYRADFAVIDLNTKWKIKGKEFLSKGNSTPFEGMEVQAKNIYTIKSGEMIWKNLERN